MAKTFQPEDKIRVYLGNISDGPVSGSYILKRYEKWIDGDKDKLFLGTHLTNDYTFGMEEEQKKAYNEKGGINKINNSKLRGVVPHATTIIQIHKEITFDYQL